MRLNLELSLYATARPPASSAGLTIRLPEDSRARLFRNDVLALDRLNDAVVAVVLVFTVIGILYSSLILNEHYFLVVLCI